MAQQQIEKWWQLGESDSSNEYTRQLDLFGGKNQRGKRVDGWGRRKRRRQQEFRLQCAVAEFARRWLKDDWKFTHFPAGERRSLMAGVRLKRMGLSPGWMDLQFFGPNRQVIFLELKSDGGKLSSAQVEIADHLIKCGHIVIVADNYNDAIGALCEHGVCK